MAVTDVVLRQAEQFLVEAITANYPVTSGDVLDLRPGTPQYDLFIRPQLPVVAQIIDRLNAAERKVTLLNATELTTTELNAVGDRFFVARDVGNTAAGSIRIKFTLPTTVTLTTSDVFTQASLTYRPTADVSIPASEMLHDAVLDYYYAQFSIAAAEIGTAYSASIGTVFTSPVYDGDTNVIEIVAVTPMFGGKDTEDATAYSERIRLAPVVANLVNRRAIGKVLGVQFAGSISRLLVVGYQEPEMLRDRISVVDQVAGNVTLAVGGHTDIYVKTPLVRDTLEIFVAAGQSIVDLSAYLAVLKVHSVKVKDKPTVSPFFRLQNSTGALRYSALDTVELFVDPGLTDEVIQVDISYAPDVPIIHAFVNSTENRIVGSNTLVRYFHPIWVGGTVYAQGLTTDQTNGAVVNIEVYLDSLVNGEQLAVSQITAAVYAAGALNVLQDYEIVAQVLYGDGTILDTSSSFILAVTDNLPKAFSQRTACFINEAITVQPLV